MKDKIKKHAYNRRVRDSPAYGFNRAFFNFTWIIFWKNNFQVNSLANEFCPFPFIPWGDADKSRILHFEVKIVELKEASSNNKAYTKRPL